MDRSDEMKCKMAVSSLDSYSISSNALKSSFLSVLPPEQAQYARKAGKLMEKRGYLGYHLWTTLGAPQDLGQCFQLPQSPKTSPTRQPKHLPAPDPPTCSLLL